MKLKDEFTKADDKKWKEIVLKNFDFVSQKITSNKDPKATAASFARQHDWENVKYSAYSKAHVVKREDLLIHDLERISENPKQSLRKQSVLDSYDDKTFTYRQLFLKLVFEQLIIDLDLTHNFEMIYEFIKVFEKDLTSLKLRIIDKTSLKSNHYWVMAILPKLKSLKHLTIYRSIETHYVQEDFFKFLTKAMQYFQRNGCSLDSFHLNNV